MRTDTCYIIMPVKDSLETAERAIRAIVDSGHTVCVYDDHSAPENAARLDALSRETGICVIHIQDYTDHPSPNYRWVLIHTQRECLAKGLDLVIVESDVIVKPETIDSMVAERRKAEDGRKTGMVAAVTVNEDGRINFPYEYARRMQKDGPCKNRFSFCCTLLTSELLQAYDFTQLDPSKNWYDVFISHTSRELGFENILQISNPVLHLPHSSRPWKQLKYSHPLLYYWRKWIYGKDKI